MEKKYKVVIEKGEDGYFIAEVPELPGCYSQGETLEQTMANIKEAIELYLESMHELKRKPGEKFVGIKEVVVDA